MELLILLFIVVLPFALILNARKRGERQRLEAKRHQEVLAAVTHETPPTGPGG